MAKVEYVVVDGCVQSGTTLVKKGEVFVPPTAEVRDLLLAEGVIVARGKLESASRAARRQPGLGQGGAPASAPAPAPDGGGGNPDEEEEEEEEEEDDDSTGN
ncbi:hypothetical protein [Pseudomonas oryziphila]|uniref:Uncharacterized protein n=1 Tax=Pseudomonas entomophila TaxID=312306 RepID=A0A3S8UI14_9PSED|nr:hypothetical protein [Pseudomonas oryziphila]AZL67943.1 hypothetical protein EJA05_09385 [Pseudomonas oryziphila]